MKTFSSKSLRNLRKAKGFTLVGNLIVLALIGIVAGLAMSNLGEIFGGGKVKAAQTWVNSTGEAYVTSYFALVGEYPKSLNDLKRLRQPVSPFCKASIRFGRSLGKPMFINIQVQIILEVSTSQQQHRTVQL